MCLSIYEKSHVIRSHHRLDQIFLLSNCKDYQYVHISIIFLFHVACKYVYNILL